MNRRKKAIFWKIDLRVKPGDIVIYEDSYYLNRNGINSNPLNDSNWLYLGDVTKKILQFTFSNNGTLENEYDVPLSVVKNLSFSGVDFEYEINEEENVLLIKLNQNKKLREVTYDELVNLKNTSSLVKGQSYLLTDYMTTYEQPVTGLMKSSGVIEPLILTAVSENQISNICRSTLYPQDIVFYEITGDIGDYNGIEGFTKGKIYRRIDTLRNNDIGTDWRHVKYDRNGVDKLLFEDYAGVSNNKIETYYLFNNVIGNNFSDNTIDNYFQNNTIDNYFQNNTIGYGFQNNKIGNNSYDNTIGNNFNTNTIGDEFQNNTIGNNFSTNTIGDEFKNNTIGNNFSTNTIGYGFQNNKIGNNFSTNTIGDEFKNNTIGNNFSTNTIGYGFQNNKIGNNSYDNTIIGDFQNNTISDYFGSNNINQYFQNNTIGNNFSTNTIEYGFQNNTIGNNFSTNTIGDGFQNNTISDYFQENTISDNFSTNTIGDEFQNNTIGYGFQNNKIGNNSYDNTIGFSFGFNTIGRGFSANIIESNFSVNKIGENFSSNGNQTTPFLSRNTEFRNYISNVASSIEIQNTNFDLVVFKSPNGTIKQRYYDDSNNLVINNL